MFFQRIMLSFFVSREGSHSSEVSYFSQGSTSRKETDLRHNSFCELWPSVWHCRHLYFQSAVICKMWVQCENFSAQVLWRKGGNKWKLAPVSCHGKNENVCSLWPAQSAAGVKSTPTSSSSREPGVVSRTAWLNSAFQKLSRTQSQTSPFPCLL